MQRVGEDTGLFGPKSASWRVHRELTVLLGGARALLMQAAHPLVIAGARETGFYERNPWKRLERTLQLTYTITFGTRAEAEASAERINEVHRGVHGVDPVTGLPYDALDPDLLLWVHACLVDSALLYEHYTVGKLTPLDRQRFHEEQMAVAEMLLLPRERIPATYDGLRKRMNEVIESGILQVTDAARQVASMFHDPPKGAQWRPVLRAAGWWAFGTLPPRVRELYGVKWNAAKEAAMRANLAVVRWTRPLLPARIRFIDPYTEGLHRPRAVTSQPGEP